MSSELRKFKGRVEGLKSATTFEKAQMAQSVLEECSDVLQSMHGRILLLESRLDAVQHGQGANNG